MDHVESEKDLLLSEFSVNVEKTMCSFQRGKRLPPSLRHKIVRQTTYNIYTNLLLLLIVTKMTPPYLHFFNNADKNINNLKMAL